MKLGDNMAPIEACNVWNDVCPRKTRPPKIGDIPRHVAVDEESPGSSTSRSVVQVQDAVATTAEKSVLERSTGCHTEYGNPTASGVLPVFETFMKPSSDLDKKVEQKISRNPEELEIERAESLKRSLNSYTSIPLGKSFNGPCPIFNEISTTSTVEQLEPIEHLKKNPWVQALKSIGETEGTLYVEKSPEEIIQVRKDSALYIDEKNIEAAELRDSLVVIGVGHRSNAGISHQYNAEETLNTRLPGPRTRRESSGYFSNLSTFDEDRWGPCTLDLANQQETPMSTRESLRERRRSSTKNRLPMGGGQQVNRMTTLVCPTANDETVVSPADNDVASVVKTGRVDMPNIEEQTSLELNKSMELDRSMENKLPEAEGKLKNRILQIQIENSASKAQGLTSYPDNLPAIERATEFSNDIVDTKDLGVKLGSVDLGSQWSTSHRAANRQRNQMVVHRYSSPSITNTELERIAETPHGENIVRSTTVFQNINAPINIVQISSPTGDDEEDDNEQVVTADSEGRDRSKENTADSRKLLPRSIKVYQLLSTQSEDRGDGDARLFDRRISLQIPRHEEEALRGNECETPVDMVCTSSGSEYTEEKKLIHADSVPILKIPSSDATKVENELRLCTEGRITSSDNASGPAIPGIRPIYPYYPYSPYASPQGSPRTNRRRPLRESRRVSIDSRQGALQLNQYKLLNNIGQGSYGIVKLAYNEEDETHYAMKILSKKKLMKKAGIFGRIAPGRKGVTNPLAKVYREIALLKKLDHPNVVKLVEVLDDPDEDNLYLVFELVQKGEVLQLPTDKPLDEETARIHFRDVVMGVEYLHYQRIVHRDIKPSNLLVDSEGRVKVADLGVSAELRVADELLSGSAGTPAFAAPETTTPGAQYSGTLCDVWSMGVTLYSLVTGKVPWDGAGSIIGVQSAVRSEPLRFPESPCLTEDLRDLVSRMLSKDPTRRITLVDIKVHSWLTNKGKEPLPNEADNCRLPVTVTDEEVARVVTRVPKLDTLILIKTMLKQHSFQNPFLSRRIVRSGCMTDDTGGTSLKQQTSTDTSDASTELLSTKENLKSKTEQFHRAGRSNSAPDSYEWQTNGRQISSDSLLPPVAESSSQEQAEVEIR